MTTRRILNIDSVRVGKSGEKKSYSTKRMKATKVDVRQWYCSKTAATGSARRHEVAGEPERVSHAND